MSIKASRKVPLTRTLDGEVEDDLPELDDLEDAMFAANVAGTDRGHRFSMNSDDAHMS